MSTARPTRTGMRLASHYLTGGSDIAATYRTLGELAVRMDATTVPVRPLFHVSDAALEFERIMRRPPRWRCSGCGWYDPRAWHHSYPELLRVGEERTCMACGQPFVLRYTGPAIKWPPVLDGPERNWALAVAKRLGIECLPAGDEQRHRRLACRRCAGPLDPGPGPHPSGHGTHPPDPMFAFQQQPDLDP